MSGLESGDFEGAKLFPKKKGPRGVRTSSEPLAHPVTDGEGGTMPSTACNEKCRQVGFRL